MKQKFYITTAIPYVNAKPHVGHALEFVQADTIARYHRLLEEEVLLLSGADENALKNVQAAEIAGMPIQQFIDTNARLFQELAEQLHVQFDVFQKGSDTTHHFAASQKLWQLCNENGDIYKKAYQGLYCIGCEVFYTADELDVNGECFEHPGKKLDLVSESNYFFRLSKYQLKLINVVSSDQLKIVPATRKNEVLAFLKQPLQDISISRSNERAKNWGVPVPGDGSQRIYVWFDALNIYQSGIGFGWNEENYSKWWPADVHVIGKGILRFHAIYWPAFLLSAKLQLPKTIFVHDYFTVNGQKMSKTLGNVIDPIELIHKYGADSLRYYFLARFSPFNDGDFSEEDFKIVYNADLANGLGNLVARVAKLSEKVTLQGHSRAGGNPVFSTKYTSLLAQYKFNEALTVVWKKIGDTDKFINDNEPWKITDQTKLTEVLQKAVTEILTVAYHLQPFLPDTSEKIIAQFTAPKITSQPPLFPRIID